MAARLIAVVLLLATSCASSSIGKGGPAPASSAAIGPVGRDHVGKDPVALPTGLLTDALDFSADRSALTDHSLTLRAKAGRPSANLLDGLSLAWNPTRAARFPDNVVEIGPSFTNDRDVPVQGIEFASSEGISEGMMLDLTHPDIDRLLGETSVREQVAALVGSVVLVDRRLAQSVLDGKHVAVDDDVDIDGMRVNREVDLGSSTVSLTLESGGTVSAFNLGVLRSDPDGVAKEILRLKGGRMLICHSARLHPDVEGSASVDDALLGLTFSVVSADDLEQTALGRKLPVRAADGREQTLTVVEYA